MLNQHKRWFHSSRVKFPFVRFTASWFLVSMYLIWMLGPKLILSNNQSRATLWVRETCLVVGLLPFMIILITASLSSKIYNKAFLREEFTFEEKNQHFPDHQSLHEISFAFEVCEVLHELGSCTGLSVLDYSDTRFREELRRSDPINQVRVHNPTLILRPRKNFRFC